MDAETRQKQIKEFVATVDWDTYDYTKHPGADMSFPDFTDAQMESKGPWPSKHYNKTSEWLVCHVADLNQIQDGEERRMLAVYGVPVEWPRKDEDEDALNDLIDELDSARESGGDDWAEAMDSHGLLDDKHYVWMRARSLGFPESLQDYDAAKEAIARIDEALAGEDGADELFEEFGFRDEPHFAWFKKRVQKAKDKAWAAHNAVLQQTFAALDERFQKNKEALAGELAPYKGVSMETWAAANAALSQGTALEQILKKLGIERPQWDEVNAEWNARMSRDTTATIATVYGQAFTGAGAGQFADAGKAVSSSMQAGFGKDVKGGDPIPFEDWIKIQAHVNAASAQGVDVNTVLAKYKLNAADWGTVGGYWALKMNSNPQEYLEKYTRLSAKYAAEFASGSAGSDIEF